MGTTSTDLTMELIALIKDARERLKTLHGRLRDQDQVNDCEWCDGHLSDALAELNGTARALGIIGECEVLNEIPLLRPITARCQELNPAAWGNLTENAA